MVIIVLWVPVERFPDTWSVGLILSKLTQPWRECSVYLGGKRASKLDQRVVWYTAQSQGEAVEGRLQATGQMDCCSRGGPLR